MTRTFRKKPVVVEAMQWDGGALEASYVIDWVLANGGTARWHEEAPANDLDGGWSPTIPEHIAIDALEGTMRADAGDWVIRGVKGEFYSCKPDIFEATYEEVEV